MAIPPETLVPFPLSPIVCGLAGALSEPTDRALLLFEGDSPDAAKRFANADPYVKNGLVTRWEVRPWTTVVGSMATNPVRP